MTLEIHYNPIEEEFVVFDEKFPNICGIGKTDSEAMLDFDMKKLSSKANGCFYGDYATLGHKIGKLVDEKNDQYGDSFHKCDEFLEILYPDGIKIEEYSNMLSLVRVFDKMMRTANGNKGDENAWQDIAGYALLAMKKD